MDIFQWVVNAVIAVLAVYAGRFWEKHDRRVKKDKELVDKILTLIPVGSNISDFLRLHDFGNSYRTGTLVPLWELRRLLVQPNSFFLNKKLEKIRKDLQKELGSFEDLVTLEVFVSERRDGYSEVVKPYETLRFLSVTKRAEGKTVSAEEIKEIENKYEETVKKLNKLSTNISDIYNLLISLAHEKL